MHSKHLTVAVAALAIAGTALLMGGCVPKVWWSPGAVVEAIALGEPRTLEISLTPTEDVEDVHIRVVPALAPFLTVEPASFASLTADTTVTLDLTLAASDVADVGVYDGVIQLKGGKKGKSTIAKPLPVTLSVLPAKCSSSTDFPNGVAAGDVDQSSAVLWARADFEGIVRFEWGTDPNFVQIDGYTDEEVLVEVQSDKEEFIPSKVVIDGLLDGTHYYYRACRGSCPSIGQLECDVRGEFRTAHAQGQHGLRFGVSSCFDQRGGDLLPFDSISDVPGRNLDFFVSLGDNVYADASKDAKAYRSKYRDSLSQSSDDNHLARARAATAFFATIDDHEVDDGFAGGAPPPVPPPWAEPKDAPFCKDGIECKVDEDCGRSGGECLALPLDINRCWGDRNCDLDFVNETDAFNDGLEAFQDYLPIRDEFYGPNQNMRTRDRRKLYRYREFGKDAALFLLDQRSFRDKAELTHIGRWEGGRTMLGAKQLADLKSDLRKADERGITWKFIFLPEPIQHLGSDLVQSDGWPGYPEERGAILQFIEDKGIGHVVFVSGDIHMSVPNNLVYQETVNQTARFSSSWDISAGPAAHAPLVAKAFSIPGLAEKEDWEQNGLIEGAFDALLFAAGKPLFGLGPEVFRPGLPHEGPVYPLQNYNRFEPRATLLQGQPLDRLGVLQSWAAAYHFSWTEFNINRVTQKLTVRTFGIRYHPKKDMMDEEPDLLVKFELPTPIPNGDRCLRDIQCQSSNCCLGTCRKNACLLD